MHPQRWFLLGAVVLSLGYVWLRGGFVGVGSGTTVPQTTVIGSDLVPETSSVSGPAVPLGQGLARATFASGCFWCTEADFDKVPGVVSTTSGYTGGRVANPSYEMVSSGSTGHAEAVEVIFDTSLVSYDELLDHYWHNVDLFAAHRQFCDIGSQYRPVIFVHDQSQREAAEASKIRLQHRFGDAIAVVIAAAGPFYRAEEYHQDYYKKNSAQYRFYRYGCGRDARLEEIWEADSGQ